MKDKRVVDKHSCPAKSPSPESKRCSVQESAVRTNKQHKEDYVVSDVSKVNQKVMVDVVSVVDMSPPD